MCVLATAALTLMLLAFWLLLHRYRGIDNDGQLYAFQALARLQPALSSDLYLQNTSQDAYTIFSPAYALVIRFLGLRSATLTLTASFIGCFLFAAWALARELCSRDLAWLTVGTLIVIPGAYGSSGVFHFSDTFLSARLPAQALVVTALVWHFRGAKIAGLLIAMAAMFVHPLMALPGLLLLACLWLPIRVAAGVAAAGTAAILAVAAIAREVPDAAKVMSVMDSAWLDIVRERSHFLFLNSWSPSDWVLNVRPFLSLILTASAIKDRRVRKLCFGASLVGMTGLAVALIAEVAPIAILVQGQAWRWVWITNFVCILLLVPTVIQVWRDPTCGALCAVLLTLGWTFSDVEGLACVVAALTIWLARRQITDRAAPYLRWTAYLLGVVAAMWVLGQGWTIFTSATAESGRETLVTRLRDRAGLDACAVISMGLLWRWLSRSRSLPALAAATAVLLAASTYLILDSAGKVNNVASPSLFGEFSDWRANIPPTSSVFLADKYDAGSFIWFTLNRPSYLSLNQSAGVVFSRATALEIKRRSEVLLPLMDPDWRLLDSYRGAHDKRSGDKSSAYRPLTAGNLRSVCGDERLGFVIAKESVGFDAIPHTRKGPWRDWNLYDCRRVRQEEPKA